jgi:hypothetical protein
MATCWPDRDDLSCGVRDGWLAAESGPRDICAQMTCICPRKFTRRVSQDVQTYSEACMLQIGKLIRFD